MYPLDMPAAAGRSLGVAYGARIVNCAPVARVYVKIFTSTFRGRGPLVPGKFPDTRSAGTWTLSGYAIGGYLDTFRIRGPRTVGRAPAAPAAAGHWSPVTGHQLHQ